MIAINIIGTGFLHLFESGGMAFKKENQLFRFSDISLGRSSEFSIPNDEHNRRLLDLGNDAALYGGMLRKKLPCQLVYDAGQVQGTLAVTSFDGDRFSCVFYEDDADWIRGIQDKKLAEVVQCSTSDSVRWSTDEFTYYANEQNIPPIALVWYDNGNLSYAKWMILPSVDLAWYLNLLSTSIGVPIQGIDATAYRMIMGTLNGGDNHKVTLETPTSTTASVSVAGALDFQAVDVNLEYATAMIFGQYVGGGSNTVKGFKALRNMKVTFPPDYPSNCFLVKVSNRLGKCEVIGGVPSNPDPYKKYNDLANKTVDFQRGQTYVFVPYDFYHFPYYGWQDIYHPLSIDVQVEDASTIALGDVWYLSANHPDMTVVEFLKSVAVALGYDLTISEADGILFMETGSGGRVDEVPVTNVVSVDSISRRVECWGSETSKVSVRFDSEDYVIDPLVTDYGIDNGQMEGVEEYRSAFSEGAVGDYGILVKDFGVDASGPKLTATKTTLAMYATGNDLYLQRVEAPYMGQYSDIADNSTCVKMKVLASEKGFFDMARTAYLFYAGLLFRWTDMQWNEGVLSLTMQKVSQFVVEQNPTPPVPYDSKVAYLETEGNNLIDTGLTYLNGGVDIDLDIMILPNSKTTNAPVAGYSTSSGRWFGQATSNQVYGCGSTASNSSIVINTRILANLVFGNGITLTINGNLVGSRGSGTPTGSFIIFRLSTTTYVPARVYSARFRDANSQVVMDLIPVRVGSVGYLYDLISGTMFGDVNGRAFIIGPDIP